MLIKLYDTFEIGVLLIFGHSVLVVSIGDETQYHAFLEPVIKYTLYQAKIGTEFHRESVDIG